MNPSSLHALIVDQHFGELPPEVAELLEIHLAENADARAEADRITQTLAVTRQAVQLHPELACVGWGAPPPKRHTAPHRLRMAGLAKAAAIALLAGAGGFLAGGNQEIPTMATVAAAPTALAQASRQDSPWARYRIVPGGTGLQVVRVENSTADVP